MSIQLMSQVYTKQLNHAHQAVLLAMADHADDNGENCFPSIARIAWKTGYSERQVQRIVKDLRRDKVLVEVAAPTRRRPTEYRIVLSAAEDKPPFGRGDKMAPLGEPGVTPEDSRGDISSNWDDTAMSPEPSLEPSSKESSLARSAREREKGDDLNVEESKWLKAFRSYLGIDVGSDRYEKLMRAYEFEVNVHGAHRVDEAIALAIRRGPRSFGLVSRILADGDLEMLPLSSAAPKGFEGYEFLLGEKGGLHHD